MAAAVARARGESSVTYTQETGAGLQPVDVEAADGVVHVSMLQEPLEIGPELDPAEVLGALGLDPSAAHPELPCRPVGTGLWHVLAPVRDDPDVLAARGPTTSGSRACSSRTAPSACTWRPSIRARHGPRPLVRPLARAGRGSRDGLGGRAAVRVPRGARRRRSRLDMTQGVEMGRASRLRCELEGDRVRVGGDATVVVDGTVFLDT